MANVAYETREKIIKQALKEIEFARDYKQKKVGNWKINEDLYYGKKVKGEEARANVDLGQMSSFVHTILSKSTILSYLSSQREKTHKQIALKD